MPINYNCIVLIGQIGTDPKLTLTKDNAKMAKALFYWNHHYSAGGKIYSEKLSIEIVMFGPRAQRFAEVAVKGRPMLIEGILKQYTEKMAPKKADARDRYRISVTYFRPLPHHKGDPLRENEVPEPESKTPPTESSEGEYYGDPIAF